MGEWMDIIVEVFVSLIAYTLYFIGILLLILTIPLWIIPYVIYQIYRNYREEENYGKWYDGTM